MIFQLCSLLFRRLCQLLLLCIFGVFSQNCHAPAPPPLELDNVNWQLYASGIANYSLQYPDAYKLDEEETGGVLFRHNGVPVLVRFTDEENGRHRGAWFGSKPVAKIELGSKQGHKYIYKHFDGPIYVRTVAYVVEHQGKFLGLEFRTDADELDKVQQKILDSFKIGAMS